MAVNKPLNIDDEDLVVLGAAGAKPTSWPTCKGYMLQRIRLAEFNRKVSDRTVLIRHDIGEAAYDSILELDFDLQQMLDELPQFYKQGVSTLMDTYKLSKAQATTIRQQGHLIQNHIISQRAVLHFPWFLRSHFDRRFAPSWDICLLCARQTVQMEADLEDAGLCASKQYKFVCALMSLFRAAVILVVEYSRSEARNTSSDTAALAQEIAKALKLLERARLNSNTATRFFDSLGTVMRKHQVLSGGSDANVVEQSTKYGTTRGSSLQQGERHSMLGQTVKGSAHAETRDGDPSNTCSEVDTSSIQVDRQRPEEFSAIIPEISDTSMPENIAYPGLDTLELGFSPDSISYQLNEFAASLESNPINFADMTWSDVFAGWDGA